MLLKTADILVDGVDENLTTISNGLGSNRNTNYSNITNNSEDKKIRKILIQNSTKL